MVALKTVDVATDAYSIPPRNIPGAELNGITEAVLNFSRIFSTISLIWLLDDEKTAGRLG